MVLAVCWAYCGYLHVMFKSVMVMVMCGDACICVVLEARSVYCGCLCTVCGVKSAMCVLWMSLCGGRSAFEQTRRWIAIGLNVCTLYIQCTLYSALIVHCITNVVYCHSNMCLFLCRCCTIFT